MRSIGYGEARPDDRLRPEAIQGAGVAPDCFVA
jgi:hypothetical protein